MKFLTALFLGILTLIPEIVKKAAIALGFGTLTYTGVNALFQTLSSYLYSHIVQIPTTLINIMNKAGFSDAIAIIIAAVSARLVFIYGLNGDTIKRWIVK